MNISNIHQSIKNILASATDMLPTAKLLGGPLLSKVIDLVTAGTAIATNIITRVEDGELVMSSNDLNEIKDKLAKLQAANDELNQRVLDS